MERKEVLLLLDLPDDSPDQQIGEKLNEKISYHETLSNNSPSAFLRRLNKQLLAKIMLVQKEIQNFLKKSAFIIENKVEISNHITDIEGESLTIPPLLSSEIKQEREKDDINEPIAYLIVHTEQLPVKPYPLFKGKNYIGRKTHPTLRPFVALEDDEFTSRIHAVVYVASNNNGRLFYINDSAESNEGKPSKNGTFLNGNKQRITQRLKIEDHDTIQVGETKLIFRINSKSLDDIMEEVEGRDYIQTIVIKI